MNIRTIPLGLMVVIGSWLADATRAAEVIPSDLQVAGDLFFDTATSFVDTIGGGTASQSGTFSAIEGGVLSDSTYDDGIASGMNPIPGVFVQHGCGVVGDGDGFTGFGTAAANTLQGTDLAEYRVDFDQGTSGSGMNGGAPIVFQNSATHGYLITMSVILDHTVDSSGGDGFARSRLEVELDGTKAFDSEIISDSFGNSINGIPTGESGGVININVTESFDFIVDAGMSRELEIDYTGEGGASVDFFVTGSSTLAYNYSLTITDVQVVPEPSGWALLASGLACLPLFRRGRWGFGRLEVKPAW